MTEADADHLLMTIDRNDALNCCIISLYNFFYDDKFLTQSYCRRPTVHAGPNGLRLGLMDTECAAQSVVMHPFWILPTYGNHYFLTLHLLRR